MTHIQSYLLKSAHFLKFNGSLENRKKPALMRIIFMITVSGKTHHHYWRRCKQIALRSGSSFGTVSLNGRIANERRNKKVVRN